MDETKSKSTSAVWPLLIGAFVLQVAIPPAMRNHFFMALLCDDLADTLAAFAILFALPYAKIKLKLLAFSYAMWTVFAFMNNMAIEVSIEDIRHWQLLSAAICLCFYGFFSSWIIGLYKNAV